MAPQERGHPPRPQLVRAERGNPDAVCAHAQEASRKERSIRSGMGMIQEAKAARRKATGIDNRADKEEATRTIISSPKGC